jgi:hypothetical protein
LPYFRITIHYNDGSSLKCIRQHQSYDIEFANRYFIEQMKSNTNGKPVNEMEVVMVSKNAKDVREFISSQAMKGNYK